MSDLTKPPHVPSCVSTGEGVTVPTATATPRTIEQAAQECADTVLNWYSSPHKNSESAKQECANLIAATMREATEQKDREITALKEVAGWAQAVLTGLNVGDLHSGSLLHLKLREVMIEYRKGQDQ